MLNTLPTIAEIAIVITGFVGLAVAMRPSLLSAGGVHGTRLRLHIAQTLTLMFLCLLPSYLIELRVDPAVEPWPAANGIMGTLQAGIMAWRVRAQPSSSDRASSGPLILAVSLYVPIIIACFANAAGLLEPHGSAIYYSGILVQLMTSSLLFVLLLFAATEKEE